MAKKTLTQAEIDEIQFQINGLENSLVATDYMSHKHADGALTDEEYEEVKNQRQAWRDEINELQAKLPKEV